MLLFSLITTAFAANLRIATWNIETLGAPGSAEYTAAAEVVKRIGAEVLCLNEIGSSTDASYISSFASATGYSYFAVATNSNFGSDRSACLSVYPIQSRQWKAPDLSGDPNANDITRYFLVVEVDLPDTSSNLVVISNHYKSGSANEDEFRRAIEAYRTEDLLATYDGNPTVFMGDLNADIGDGANYPAVFTSKPSRLPTSYRIGTDIQGMLSSGGLGNDSFSPLYDYVSLVDATQTNGSLATRPSSGRRLDYILVSPEITATGMVYNSSLDTTTSTFWEGSPPSTSANATASDHLPVVADLKLP